ncbi:MAG: SpoIIE family protein phosphatase [Candidatus Zixiibacteriota bacterium]
MGNRQIAIVKSPAKHPHCGDQAGWWEKRGRVTLCIIDALGHGLGARQVAEKALACVARHHSEPLPDIFAYCDRELHHTRGAAMAVATINDADRTLTYAGVGNIRAVVIGRKMTRLLSTYGIVGAGCDNLSIQTVSLKSGDLVILCTDGIDQSFDISAYSDALKKDVNRLARQILSDWRRENDDAAVIVYRR